MLRRDTFVIKIFQSVAEKNAGGEFIPLAHRQSHRLCLLRAERSLHAPRGFPRHSSFHEVARRQFPKKLYLICLPMLIAA